MKFSIILLTLTFFFKAYYLSGQNRPAPNYLTTQALPDSVKKTKVIAINGTETTLSTILDQYKGRKILVDFWASWCKDCIVTLPKYNKLRKKTKAQKIVYLLLSVDKEDAKWKLAITRFKIKGDHYRFAQGWKNPFSNYIDLDWVPRYLIIDELGNIIKPKSIHIDDPALFAELKGLKQ